MLYFVFGRAGSGKTTYLRNLVRDFVQNSEVTPLLIVPEQYSFESEREMLRVLGAQNMNRAQIFSFSRLASKIISKYRKHDKPYITDAERAAVMSICVEELSDTLNIYGRHMNSPEVLAHLVSADTELRQFCVSPEQISEASEKTGDQILKAKLKEVALISEVYRAELYRHYEDDNTALDELAEIIAEYDLFRDSVIMLDSFRGFTRQEEKVFAELIKRARAVYITVCSEDFTDESEGFGAFTHTTSFAKRLRAVAKESSVVLAKPAYLSSAAKFNNFPPKNTRRFSRAIAALEYSLYAEDKEIYTEPADDIILVSAEDKADECDFAAREIKRLVREDGMRCRDICVIERTEGSYKPFLINAIRRYGLPVFDDARRNVSDEPLICAVYYAMESIAKGFSTQSIMRYLKTGLTDIDLIDVCLVDNYTVVWDIDTAAWKSEWKNHPSGLGFALDEKASAELKKINEIRERIILPLLKLRNAAADADGLTISKALFDFISETKIPDKFRALAIEAEKEGVAGEIARKQEVWDALVLILEQAASLLKGRRLTLKRYCELFGVLCSKTTLGVIPNSLDEITVGSADRIRTGDVRAVFVVGANEGVFPLNSSAGGVFTESDRRELQKIGIDISLPFEYRAAEERFISYCALTAATEKLYVSYSRGSISSDVMKPSEIAAHIEQYFPNCKKTDTKLIAPTEKIESGESALSVMAEHITEDSTLSASLRRCLSDSDAYRHRLTALENAAFKREKEIEDENTAKLLFGENIRISASRLQSYFECPFSYFCKYGLSIKELKAASLDPANSGSVIHYVLEQILREMNTDELIKADEDELRARITELLNEYLESMMGGAEGKSKRFMALFYRLTQAVLAVISRLKNEFSAGSFVPAAFELKIGGDEVDAYSVKIPDGSEVKVTGFVDRVDIMEKNGKKYLRIIDYKTGKKEFLLSDVIQGLNIQMCLYLMAIQKNGKKYFGDIIPAGVLYLPSRVGISEMVYGRETDEEEVKARHIKSGKLSGMILSQSDVIEGMGVNSLKDYLPVKIKKDGSLSGNLYSAEQFGRLSAKIDNIIEQMGLSLHKGKIPVLPCSENDKLKSCSYCEYSSLCGFEEGDSVRNIVKMSHDEAVKELEGECENEQ